MKTGTKGLFVVVVVVVIGFKTRLCDVGLEIGLGGGLDGGGGGAGVVARVVKINGF